MDLYRAVKKQITVVHQRDASGLTLTTGARPHRDYNSQHAAAPAGPCHVTPCVGIVQRAPIVFTQMLIWQKDIKAATFPL